LETSKKIKNEIDLKISEYFSNPFPHPFGHFTLYDGYEGQNKPNFHLSNELWTEVVLNNFSLDPSLYRKQICKNFRFKRELRFEIKFGDKSNLKQIFTKFPIFFHRNKRITW